MAKKPEMAKTDSEREKLKGKFKVNDSIVYLNVRGSPIDARIAETKEDSDGNPLVRLEFRGSDGQWHDLGWRELQSKKHQDTAEAKEKHGRAYLK